MSKASMILKNVDEAKKWPIDTKLRVQHPKGDVICYVQTLPDGEGGYACPVLTSYNHYWNEGQVF